MDLIRQRYLSKIQKATDSVYDHEILLVDDNPFGTLTLEMILQTEGFQNLRIFDDPEAVLKHAKEFSRPALVITDFQMPKYDGVELLQELDRLYPGIEGIIVTGAPDIARQCSGRFPVLEKGDSVHGLLIDLVWSILDKDGTLRNAQSDAQIEPRHPGIDKDYLFELIAESSRLENTVARFYLHLSGIFRQEQSFWLDLYIEEKMHAAIFNIFTQNEIPIETFPTEMVDTDIGSLRQNIAMVDAKLDRYKSAPPSLVEACRFSLEIEQMVTERLFQEVITQDKPDTTILLLQRINKDSHDHYQRILEFTNRHTASVG